MLKANLLKRFGIWLYLFTSILSFIIVFGIYLSKFGVYGISDNQQFWSYLGDYLGGVLTPLLTIITIIILLNTLKLQRDELELQREEIKMTREDVRDQTKNLQRQSLLLQQNQFLLTYYKLIERIISVQHDDDDPIKLTWLNHLVKMIDANIPKKTNSSDIPILYNRLLILILSIKLLISNAPIIDFEFYSSYLRAQINKESKLVLSKCEYIDDISVDNISMIKSFLEKL